MKFIFKMNSRFLTLCLVLPVIAARSIESGKDRTFATGYLLRTQRSSRSTPGRVRNPHLALRSSPPETVVIPQFGSKVLECEAGGNPPPTIHWLKNGHRLQQSAWEALQTNAVDDGNHDVAAPLGLSFTRSRLYLDCATGHADVYTCVAENPYHRVSSDTNIVIQEATEEENRGSNCVAKKSFGSPARVHMWTRTRLELAGSDVQLFCRSAGIPTPHVTWLGPEDTRLASGDKYELLENGDLVIRNLEWSDMGGYTCVAENSNGSDQTLIFLYPTMPNKRK